MRGRCINAGQYLRYDLRYDCLLEIATCVCSYYNVFGKIIARITGNNLDLSKISGKLLVK